ncbi:exonuclease SbcCD subunit D [Paenibacillus puldeungensis]|uniref:Exonuclease SbcCD subunit D n=1 Tax=Paenibacillus puldeungensis TaxID=696536 RepID=A0ABW3RXW9_9BACL
MKECESMNPFRFLHAADLHLDTPFSGMSGVPNRLRRFLQESTFTAFDNLVHLAIAEAVDFVVLSGDIYDASDSSLRAQLRLREAWDKLGRHGIPVYLIHGNHDPLGSRRLRLELPPHVTEFGTKLESRTAVRRSDDQPVAIISGVSYGAAAVTDNLALQFLRDPSSPLYHIALLHGNVDGQEGHDAYAPCSLRDLKESGYDYWALGHIHKRQILHEGAPWVVYPGNIQGRSLKETGAKGCYIVDVSESGAADLQFHRLDQVTWLETEMPIDDLSSEEAWKDRVEETLEEIRAAQDGKMSVVRLVFTGQGPLHTMLQSGPESAELLQELRRKETIRLEEAGVAAPPAGEIVWPAGFKVNTAMEIDRDFLLGEDSFLGELLRLGSQAAGSPELLDSLTQEALASLRENRLLRRLLKEQEQEVKDREELLRRAEELAAAILLGEETSDGRASS